MIYERLDCRLCGGYVTDVLTLTPTPLANLFPDEPYAGEKFPLGLKQCGQCKHVQVSHVVRDQEIFNGLYRYETPAALSDAMKVRAKQLREQYKGANTLLEIGANNGLFLHALHDAGFPVVIGIDPSSTDPLVWKLPFNVKSALLVKERIGKVDLIIANNVFAHIDDLRHIFTAIDTVLSPDGALVFEVQYLLPMAKRGAFDMIYHEHRDYHTLGPLSAFLFNCGLVMTDYEIFSAHGGSIRVTAKRGGLAKEPPLEEIYWSAFELAIGREKSALRGLLPKRIPAFGAPAKAVTLIHHFGLQDRIEYCVDDTKGKQGRYIAGTNIPVVGAEVMEKDKPKEMLLLSWNYADIIRKRFPHIDFIVPFSQRQLLAA